MEVEREDKPLQVICCRAVEEAGEIGEQKEEWDHLPELGQECPVGISGRKSSLISCLDDKYIYPDAFSTLFDVPTCISPGIFWVFSTGLELLSHTAL